MPPTAILAADRLATRSRLVDGVVSLYDASEAV